MIRRRSAVTSATTSTLALILLSTVIVGCASSAAPPRSPRPTGAALAGIRRVVVVASGESRFTVESASKEPGQEFDEIVKWLPYKDILVPIAKAVYWGITWLIDDARTSSTIPRDVTPAAVVTDAFARTILE